MKTNKEWVMIGNFLLSSWRYLSRHKVFTLINIACLTIGLACSFLVLIWVRYELSYDRFHEHSGRLYRVTSDIPFGDEVLHAAITARAVGGQAVKEVPGIERSVRVRPYPRPILRYREKVNTEPGIFVTDPSFFEMFSFPLISGDPRTCLLNSASIVISEELARDYFGTLNPLGRVMEVNNHHRCQVTGVFSSADGPSHLQFNALLPFTLDRQVSMEQMNPWRRFNLYTYVLLSKDAEPEKVANGIRDVFRESDPEYDPSVDAEMDFHLQDIRDIHQEPDLYADLAGRGDRRLIIIFLAVAMVILVIAMINFVNHTTARARLRYKEIAIRKSFGASRRNLILQFLGESLLISLVSLLLAISLMELMVSVFNRFMMEGLSFYLERDYQMLGVFFIISLFAGIVAGIYPAFSMSKIEPIRVLRVEPGLLRRRSGVRRALVILQFAVSIAILACTLIVGRQVSYVREKSLGFEHENIIYLGINPDLQEKLDKFRDEAEQIEGVESVTATSILPMLGTASSSQIRWEGMQEQEEFRVNFRFVDEDFLETMDIPLVKGNDFPDEPGLSDSLTFLVNEAFAEHIRDREVLGLPLTFADIRHGRIVGVTADFHTTSLHEPLGPVLLMLGKEELGFLMLKIDPSQTSTLFPQLEKLWKSYTYPYPFEYTYLSDRYDGLYREEARTYSLLAYFTVLALLISFLGLFGLAAFRSEQRRKEIGIRKVYGASPANITLRYAREVGNWILWSGLLALPVAWYAMDRWLDRFAYTTAVSPIYLLLALLSALVVAMLATSWQVILSARLNPADALRYE